MGVKICYFLTYILSTYCRYCQLGFSSKIEVPQLSSARKLHSSAWLEPKNSSSNSSLVTSGFLTAIKLSPSYKLFFSPFCIFCNPLVVIDMITGKSDNVFDLKLLS